MKTILGFFSAALAGATTPGIAPAAMSSQAVVRNVRLMILPPPVRVLQVNPKRPTDHSKRSASLVSSVNSLSCDDAASVLTTRRRPIDRCLGRFGRLGRVDRSSDEVFARNEHAC